MIVMPEDIRKAELRMNYYAKLWCKVLNIGEAAGTGQRRRRARALVGNFVTIPSLQGIRKDYKRKHESHKLYPDQPSQSLIYYELL